MSQNDLRVALNISVTKSKWVTHANGLKLSNGEITHVQGSTLFILHITKVCKN